MNKMGKTICVFSPKGGVGKTVLSLNLAGICELTKKKVLLLDLDIQSGSLGMIINQEINKTIYNISEDLKINKYKSILDYTYKYSDYTYVLPSLIDPRQKVTIDSIKRIINDSKYYFDIIIIDTCSKLDEYNLLILDSVDEVLFVTINDLFTLKNTRNIITIFNECNITNYKVLLNASIDFKVPYFSLLDIKKIINSNIDYLISKNLYSKDISSYIYESKIPILMKNVYSKCPKDINTLKLIINDLERINTYEEKN